MDLVGSFLRSLATSRSTSSTETCRQGQCAHGSSSCGDIWTSDARESGVGVEKNEATPFDIDAKDTLNRHGMYFDVALRKRRGGTAKQWNQSLMVQVRIHRLERQVEFIGVYEHLVVSHPSSLLVRGQLRSKSLPLASSIP